MKIIYRYIAMRFLSVFLMTLLTATILYIIIDFVEHSRTLLIDSKILGSSFLLTLFKIPIILVRVTSISILFATILVMMIFQRFNELTAMNSNGIPLKKISIPILGCVLFISVMMFLINETSIPYCNRMINKIDREKFGMRNYISYFQDKADWFEGKRFFYFFPDLQIKGDNLTAKKGALFLFKQNFLLKARYDFEQIARVGHQWVLSGVDYRTFSNGTLHYQHLAEIKLLADEKIELFDIKPIIPDEMNILELSQVIQQQRASQGEELDKLKIELYGKISFFLINIIICILAIPLSLNFQKTKSYTSGILVGLIISFAYYLLYNLNVTLGKKGIFSPGIAAWGINILFAAVAIRQFFKIDRIRA